MRSRRCTTTQSIVSCSPRACHLGGGGQAASRRATTTRRCSPIRCSGSSCSPSPSFARSPVGAVHEGALGARREHGVLDRIDAQRRRSGSAGPRIADRPPHRARDGQPAAPRAGEAAGARALPVTAPHVRRRRTARCHCAACSSAGCSRAPSGATRDARPRRRSTRPRSSTCARTSSRRASAAPSATW